MRQGRLATDREYAAKIQRNVWLETNQIKYYRYLEPMIIWYFTLMGSTDIL